MKFVICCDSIRNGASSSEYLGIEDDIVINTRSARKYASPIEAGMEIGKFLQAWENDRVEGYRLNDSPLPPAPDITWDIHIRPVEG